MSKIKYGPQCPNHHITLVGLPNPLTEKGQATCPISGCSFDYEIELDKEEMKQDSKGNIIKVPKWKAEGQES
jgi:hypothetical protein